MEKITLYDDHYQDTSQNEEPSDRPHKSNPSQPFSASSFTIIIVTIVIIKALTKMKNLQVDLIFETNAIIIMCFVVIIITIILIVITIISILIIRALTKRRNLQVDLIFKTERFPAASTPTPESS